MLDRTTDLGETAMDGVLDILRASVPCIILDVPHGWNAWIRRTLIAADEIVIVAAPDLASLRNAKNLFDSLSQARPTDRKPRVILNQVGVPKRPRSRPRNSARRSGSRSRPSSRSTRLFSARLRTTGR
jgi:pilus assembly protein CpaE